MATAAKGIGGLVIISGPSGVGKSTICAELVGKIGVFLSISATTRPRSSREIDGNDYFFISTDEFKKRISENRFLEYAEVFGNYYGTPRQPIEKALGEGRIVVLEIDIEGAKQVKRVYPDALTIFILPPGRRDLSERMDARNRGQDARTRQMRLDHAQAEIEASGKYYQYKVVNKELEKAVDEIVGIIKGNFEAKK